MTQEFLHKIFLSNSIQKWLVAIAVILAALFFSKIISRILARLFVKFFTKVNHQQYADIFQRNIVNPLSRYIFWTITVYALDNLAYPQELVFSIFKTNSHAALDALSAGWLTICFFRLVIGVIAFASTLLKNNAAQKNERSLLQMISLLADLTRAVLIVLCILCVLKFSFNYSLASFITSLGLVTAALALAAKESVENIICSFVIFLDKPFLVGDSIVVNGISGSVEKIGLRSTLLRTDAKTIVSMPNRTVIGGALENTSNQTYRRFTQTLELDPDTQPEAIEQLCTAILDLLKAEAADSIVMPTVYFKETGVNSHKIYMEYFGAMNLTLAQFRARVQQNNLKITGLIQSSNIHLIRMNYR